MLSCCTGESLGNFIKLGCTVLCPVCFVPESAFTATPLDIQAEGSKLSKGAYAKYLKAVAEPEVMAAVRAAVDECKAQMKMDVSDQVSAALAVLFQPERCGSCDAAFAYHGGCTSMPCMNCKKVFCLWCRAVFQTTGEGHSHAWNCDKAPSTDAMLTESKVFPAGHDLAESVEFIEAVLKVRKLEMLQFQLQQGACSVLHGQSGTSNPLYRMVL